MGIKVLSLFDGMSCGQIALNKLGIEVDEYVAYEIDNYATQITNKNFPNTIQMGNVFEGDYYKYGGFDLLIGGSPCTHWSISSSNREITSDGIGFKLFNQFVRAKEESKCKYFLYENNYKIHDDIKNEITNKLGVKPILINSSIFSAQSRNRLYWTNIPIKNIPIDKEISVKDILDINFTGVNIINETTFNDNKQSTEYQNKSLRIGTINKGGQGERVYSIYGKSINLTANGGGKGARTGLYLIGDIVRKLSVLEAERLQCVPDNYTEGVSDTQRYKMIGNGWTVDVIAHIFEGLKVNNI